jgi:hypothetical protein
MACRPSTSTVLSRAERRSVRAPGCESAIRPLSAQWTHPDVRRAQTRRRRLAGTPPTGCGPCLARRRRRPSRFADALRHTQFGVTIPTAVESELQTEPTELQRGNNARRGSGGSQDWSNPMSRSPVSRRRPSYPAKATASSSGDRDCRLPVARFEVVAEEAPSMRFKRCRGGSLTVRSRDGSAR